MPAPLWVRTHHLEKVLTGKPCCCPRRGQNPRLFPCGIAPCCPLAQPPNAHPTAATSPGISHRHLPSARRRAAAKLPPREDRGTHRECSWWVRSTRQGGGASHGAPGRGREQAGFSPRPGLGKGGASCRQAVWESSSLLFPLLQLKKGSRDFKGTGGKGAAGSCRFPLPLPEPGAAQGRSPRCQAQARPQVRRQLPSACPDGQLGCWRPPESGRLERRKEGKVAEWRSCDRRVPGWGGEGRQPSSEVGKERRRAGSQRLGPWLAWKRVEWGGGGFAVCLFSCGLPLWFCAKNSRRGMHPTQIPLPHHNHPAR